MIRKISYALMAGALLALTGCAHHQIIPLKHVAKDDADFIEQKEGIELRLSKITPETEKECFSGRSLPCKKTVPLKMTVKNMSPFTIYLSPRHIGLGLAHEQEIVQYLKSSVWTPLLAGLGVATAGNLIASTTSEQALETAASIAGTGAMIAGAAASVTAVDKNDEVAVDVHEKIFHNIELWPGEKITKLLFAHKQGFKKHFHINVCQLLVNEKGKSAGNKLITFNVKL